MKKITIIVTLFISIITICYSFEGKIKKQTFNITNLILLAQARGEGDPIAVPCNSCWRDCFFGCEQKYRCNGLQACQPVMAKASCEGGVADTCYVQ